MKRKGNAVYNNPHFRGLGGEGAKKTLPKEEGREGGEKSARGRRARGSNQDLLHARRGSPAARHGGCLDKQTFPCL